MIGPVRSGSAVDLLTSIRLGEASASEVVAEHLKALRRVDAETNAVAAFEDERAQADAARLDEAFAATGPVGPLHGLPITVKDWIDVEGFVCAGDGGRSPDRRPEQDATVVARLRRAGAVVVAKTRPWGAGPRVTHPLDPARSRRRIEQRRGGRRGDRRITARDRERLWRQHPPPGRVVRRLRPQVDRRARADDRATSRGWAR